MERKTRQIGERRATVDFPAKCGPVAMEPSLEGRVTQISTTGLRLRTSHELTIGAVISVIFNGDGAAPNAWARVEAQVVRALPGYKPDFEYGLRVVSDRGVLVGAD